MFGKFLTALGLAALLTTPAFADLGLILPDTPMIDDPEKKTLGLIVAVVNPATGQGFPIERPQVLTALRYSGENMERSEHLSVIAEAVAYGARAWTTEIALPHPGVYHLIMQTKPCWFPEQDTFVQYITKVQVPAYGSAEGWNKPDNVNFEVVPLSRPFGLYAGMSFSGQAMFDGKPMPGAIIEVSRLDPAIKPEVGEPVAPDAVAQEEQKTPSKPKKEDKPFVPQSISAFGDVQQLKTDSQGVFTFTCPLPGWWAFSTSMAGDPLQDPDGRQKPLETKTIFWVYISDMSKAASKK